MPCGFNPLICQLQCSIFAYLPNATQTTILLWLKNLKTRLANNMLHTNTMACLVRLAIFFWLSSKLPKHLENMRINYQRLIVILLPLVQVKISRWAFIHSRVWVMVVPDIKAKKRSRTESLPPRRAREVVELEYKDRNTAAALTGLLLLRGQESTNKRQLSTLFCSVLFWGLDKNSRKAMHWWTEINVIPRKEGFARQEAEGKKVS